MESLVLPPLPQAAFEPDFLIAVGTWVEDIPFASLPAPTILRKGIVWFVHFMSVSCTAGRRSSVCLSSVTRDGSEALLDTIGKDNIYTNREGILHHGRGRRNSSSSLSSLASSGPCNILPPSFRTVLQSPWPKHCRFFGLGATQPSLHSVSPAM